MKVFFFPEGCYSLLIYVKSLHRTFPWSHILVDERWSLSLAGYCWDVLKASKALQTWDLLLGDGGLYSPSRWQVTAGPHNEHAWDDDHNLFVRACEQTYCSHKSNGLCSCSKHTACSNIDASVCEYPGSVLLCLPSSVSKPGTYLLPEWKIDLCLGFVYLFF